jgi:hypothetical protein
MGALYPKQTSNINVVNTNISVGAEGTQYLSKVAGEALSGHRMVVLNSAGKAVYADNTTMTHVSKVLGMTVGSAVLDAAIDILRWGELEEPSWSWTLDLPIFLSTSGLLTQTPPTTGFSQIIGFPVSATKAYISLREPIIL